MDFEKYKAQRLKAWQRAGIKIEDFSEFIEMYEKAGGKCEACGTPLSIGNDPEHATAALDHDHETGQMRGILCSIHNYDMWKYERYPPDELIGMAIYLIEKVAKARFSISKLGGDKNVEN